MEIKNDILRFVKKGYVSFAELSNHIEGFRGEFTYHTPGMENLVLWTCMSEEACKALTELLESKQIVAVPASLLIYLADGSGIALPIAKKAINYKKPHWMPIIFNPAKQSLPQ